VFDCDGKCGSSQFGITYYLSLDQYGRKGICGSGHRSLCCDATPVIQKCHWTDCDWTNDSNGNCASNEISAATRHEQNDSTLCKSQTGIGNGGSNGPITHQHSKSYCCPKDDPLEKCSWANDPDYFYGKWIPSLYQCTGTVTVDQCRKLGTCHSQACFEGKLAVTRAMVTPQIFELIEADTSYWIFRVSSEGPALCCSPPSRLTKDWPVNSAYL
jgi:hypothetical protein